MGTLAATARRTTIHPVQLHVEPALAKRDRLTTAFRPLLAIPHLVLVGGPIAATFSWSWRSASGARYDVSTGGVLGAVAVVVAVIAWFAIVFTGRYPPGLWSLAVFYLRWRVRAAAYVALLRDEYPPFGDGPYPVRLVLEPPDEPDVPRDRVSVGFRIVLAVPHLIAVWVLGVAWACTTLVAWVAILLTGAYPPSLYQFAVGVLRWSVRVEAYLLLLHDEYPPFSLAA